MHTVRQRLRAFTWIALFAMFGLALAPTISHALDANKASSPWAQICSTVSGGASGSPALPGGLGHLDHCPLCGYGAGPLGLPPSAVASLPAPLRDVLAARAGGITVVHVFTRSEAQPRAPPSFC